MNRDEISTEQSEAPWFIDLDWFPKHNRSFTALAWDCLCPACRQRLQGKLGEIAAADLLATIRDCCSKAPGFIGGELPILESIFHLFLANGNQALDVEELANRLSEGRGGDSYRTSPEVLSRLLKSDQHYGLRQFQG